MKVHISSTEPWIRISVFGDESDSLKRQAGKKKKKKKTPLCYILLAVGSIILKQKSDKVSSVFMKLSFGPV